MKATLDDCAIFGGPSEFDAPLHVGRPNVGDRGAILERIGAALDRRWLTNDGPNVCEFESRVANLTGVRHCVAVSSGTMALALAARAAGLTGEVIVPSFTFVGTAHALLWLGITPVFCDVDPQTHNIDPLRVEELITPRTSGILGVHLWGRPCDIGALERIAEEHGLRLLFDAAHAFGCRYQGAMIGSFGDAEAFSFHATKCVNTCEGGAIVTQDSELAAKARAMRNFGFVDYDCAAGLGVNGKLNEISAAIGLASLDAMGGFLQANRSNYACYGSQLQGVAGVRLVRYEERGASNYHYIVLEIDEARAGLSRDALRDMLWRENVLARRYFYPGCHRMKPYSDCFLARAPACPKRSGCALACSACPMARRLARARSSGFATSSASQRSTPLRSEPDWPREGNVERASH
ncbi:MAG TPA: DegT/DnrJ/EryC1/StrS family aminotransferase [Bryobacteraceae bacterium]|nr:DegT/DnrJ/EryC1/StrS family aminotransferase [Bryobacteraceae bacterium]